jgi:hypothetical protein
LKDSGGTGIELAIDTVPGDIGTVEIGYAEWIVLGGERYLLVRSTGRARCWG